MADGAAPLVSVNGRPIASRSCGSCVFGVGGGREVYCRANPPTLHMVTRLVNGAPQTGQMVAFPKVEPDWWCGQFKAQVHG